MAAVLANWGGYYSQRVYLSEARRLGLAVRPPHVNFSGRNFVYTHGAGGEKALFMGLDQVRDLTRRTIERIIQGRPFASLEDFLVRVDPRPQEVADLARVGALEGFGTIPALLRRVEGGGPRKSARALWQHGQPPLFEFEMPAEEEAPDWTPAQKVAAQLELLGASLEAHPLELAAEQIRAAGAISTVEAAEQVGQQVTVAGLRQSGHRSKTAKGEAMMFLTLEDLSGMLDVVLFPDAYRRAREAVHSSAPLLVTGVVEVDENRAEPLLRAEKVIRITNLQER
jgi:DNA polymerase III alpha subunit